MWLVGLLDGVKPPECKEDADFLARGGRSVGEDEGGEGFVEVVAEEDKGLALGIRRGEWGPYGAWCRLFYFYSVYAAL